MANECSAQYRWSIRLNNVKQFIKENDLSCEGAEVANKNIPLLSWPLASVFLLFYIK